MVGGGEGCKLCSNWKADAARIRKPIKRAGCGAGTDGMLSASRRASIAGLQIPRLEQSGYFFGFCIPVRDLIYNLDSKVKLNNKRQAKRRGCCVK